MTAQITQTNAPAVKIASKLPDTSRNGLIAAAPEMIDNPGQLRVALVVLATTGVEEDFEKQTVTAKTQIRRIEVVTGDDLAVAKKLLLRAADLREGKDVLPYATEEEIETIFASFVADDTIPGVDGDGDEGGADD